MVLSRLSLLKGDPDVLPRNTKIFFYFLATHPIEYRPVFLIVFLYVLVFSYIVLYFVIFLIFSYILLYFLIFSYIQSLRAFRRPQLGGWEAWRTRGRQDWVKRKFMVENKCFGAGKFVSGRPK